MRQARTYSERGHISAWHLLLVAVVLIAACVVYAQRLSRPFIHHHDWPAAEMSMIARNTLRYGLLSTRFGQVLNVIPATPETFRYLVHAPPGIIFVLAGAIRLVGFSEFGARLGPFYLTLVANSALYALARRLYGRAAGLWAMILFAFSPAVVYFGPAVTRETLMQALGLLLAGVYLGGSRHAGRNWLWLMLALAVVAVWSHWEAYLLLPLLWVHAQLWGHRSMRLGMWLVGGAAMLAAGLMIASFAWQRSDFLVEMIYIVRFRTGNASPAGSIFTTTGGSTFTWLDWLSMEGGRTIWLFTPTVVSLTIYGAYRIWRRSREAGDALVLALFLAALSYVVVVRQASYIHDYLLFTLGAPLATWAAWGLVSLWRRWRRAPILRAALVVLVLLYGIGSLRWTTGLYHFNTKPELLVIGQELASRTQPTDRIATDLIYPGPVPAFYSDREITYGVPLADMLAGQGRAARADWFLYCAEGGQEPDPVWLDDYQHEPLHHCMLLRLR